MDSQELQKGLFELIGYMLTSARGLVNEPPLYGPFRLVDGVSRLCSLLETEGGEYRAFYLQLKEKIDEKKFLVMTDEDAFIRMIDEAVLDYTKRLKAEENR
jgi:hypothetical protein